MVASKALGAAFCGLAIILAAHPLDYDLGQGLIVWNVGQGQWVTSYHEHSCLHFDAGGESLPPGPLNELCGRKLNQLWLSHWDSDHINLMSRLRKKLTHWCVMGLPVGRPSPKKRRYVEGLPMCPREGTARWIHSPAMSRTNNEASRVSLRGHWLVPGDSPRSQEKIWSKYRDLNQVKSIVLGHHGSRTSSGDQLLERLPHLRQAVASARLRRYGHPHQEIRQRLKRRGLALLQTEIWGSLRFPD